MKLHKCGNCRMCRWVMTAWQIYRGIKRRMCHNCVKTVLHLHGFRACTAYAITIIFFVENLVKAYACLFFLSFCPPVYFLLTRFYDGFSNWTDRKSHLRQWHCGLWLHCCHAGSSASFIWNCLKFAPSSCEGHRSTVAAVTHSDLHEFICKNSIVRWCTCDSPPWIRASTAGNSTCRNQINVIQ